MKSGSKKPWYKSRTIWFNVLGAGVEVVQLFGSMAVISPENLTLAMGVGNILLRLVTGQSIGKPEGNEA